MDNPKSFDFAVTCRGLIVDRGELLICRLKPEIDWFCLPGGKLDVGERLEDGMARELLEETGVKAEVGKPLIINDWIADGVHRIEFLFWIRNGRDFREADFKKASHGHELVELIFSDLGRHELRPAFLHDKLPRLIELGEDYPMEVIESS